jgi:hypothetical protein
MTRPMAAPAMFFMRVRSVSDRFWFSGIDRYPVDVVLFEGLNRRPGVSSSQCPRLSDECGRGDRGLGVTRRSDRRNVWPLSASGPASSPVDVQPGCAVPRAPASPGERRPLRLGMKSEAVARFSARPWIRQLMQISAPAREIHRIQRARRLGDRARPQARLVAAYWLRRAVLCLRKIRVIGRGCAS